MSVRSARRRFATGALAVATVAGAIVLPASPASSVAADPVGIAPIRLVETRPNATDGTVDGASFGAGPMSAGQVTSFVARGRGTVPGDAAAVILNVTAVGPQARGFLTVFPCPSGQVSASDVPTASNLNVDAGRNVANAVIVAVGAGNRVCVFSSVATNLVVDANGYVPAGGSPNTIEPVRFADTRPAGVTFDGASRGSGPVAGGTVFSFVAAGRGVVPANADAVVLNVTAANPLSNGFMTVFPCPPGQVSASSVPTASNLNFTAGQNVPNLVVVRVGDGGRICVFTSATSNVIVDVGGWVPDGANPATFTPARLVETRNDAVIGTVDGEDFGGGPMPGDRVLAFDVNGRGPVGSSNSAVVLNVAAVRPQANGFLTVFPCPFPLGSTVSVPNASNLNFVAGQNVANAVVARVGPGGQVCVYSSATTELVIDVSGNVPSPPSIDVTDTSVAPSTTAPPGSSPTTGTWKPLANGPGGPVRWDPCSTITFQVDPGPATEAEVQKLFDAMAVVEQATGLDFVFAGSYTASYTSLIDDGGTPGDSSDDVYAPSLAPGAAVGITLTDSIHVPAFDEGLLGFAIPRWTGSGEIIQGTVTLNADLDPFFDAQLVWMHEFGHLVGLAHVAQSTVGELMKPAYDPSLSGFGPGDRQGLWNVGAAQPCFTTFSAGTDLNSAYLPTLAD